MTPNIRPLVAGNWKMNGLRDALGTINEIAQSSEDSALSKIDMLLCPPATLLYVATTLCEDVPLQIGGQDCHANKSGAHTGDISADMIADCLGTQIIVGHSERRTDHGETDSEIRAKAEAAIEAGLVAIVCIGETEEERKSGKTLDVLKTQLAGSVPDNATAANTVIAYEPVWAIGTGETATPEQAQEMHAFIRSEIAANVSSKVAAQIPILYGGSVKPDNAQSLFTMPDVDGALVGGASLKVATFCEIVNAL